MHDWMCCLFSGVPLSMKFATFAHDELSTPEIVIKRILVFNEYKGHKDTLYVYYIYFTLDLDLGLV